MVLRERESPESLVFGLLMRNGVREPYRSGLKAKYATALGCRGQRTGPEERRRSNFANLATTCQAADRQHPACYMGLEVGGGSIVTVTRAKRPSAGPAFTRSNATVKVRGPRCTEVLVHPGILGRRRLARGQKTDRPRSTYALIQAVSNR